MNKKDVFVEFVRQQATINDLKFCRNQAIFITMLAMRVKESMLPVVGNPADWAREYCDTAYFAPAKEKNMIAVPEWAIDCLEDHELFSGIIKPGR